MNSLGWYSSARQPRRPRTQVGVVPADVTSSFLSAVVAEANQADVMVSQAMRQGAFAVSQHRDHQQAIASIDAAYTALKHPAQVAQSVLNIVVPGQPAYTQPPYTDEYGRHYAGVPALDDKGNPIIIPDDPAYAAQVAEAKPQAKVLRDYLNSRGIELQDMRSRVVADSKAFTPLKLGFATPSGSPYIGPGFAIPGSSPYLGPGLTPAFTTPGVLPGEALPGAPLPPEEEGMTAVVKLGIGAAVLAVATKLLGFW